MSLENASERAATVGVLLVGITGIVLTSLPMFTRWGLRAAARRAAPHDDLRRFQLVAGYPRRP